MTTKLKQALILWALDIMNFCTVVFFAVLLAGLAVMALFYIHTAVFGGFLI